MLAYIPAPWILWDRETMGNPVSKNAISECGIHLKNAINHPYPKQKNMFFVSPMSKTSTLRMLTNGHQTKPHESNGVFGGSIWRSVSWIYPLVN
jgi:hypothetical protein